MIIPRQNLEWKSWLDKYFRWFLLLGILVNISGLFITILEPDGALYATIAKTIAQTGDFINLKVGGKDWLDKPHFPFWMAALFYKLFGINSFAYKFPAFLFWAIGGRYTYIFAKSIYGKGIAQLAVLIYVCAAHLVISNNDVRAEPYLTGLCIGSVFHFYKASQQKIGMHIIYGSFLAALAIMTKGPFILITISGGFIADWILKKDWKQFINLRWYLAALLIAVFIVPELYCLYIQFDLHPGKIVFGHTGVSGIRFFFWDSQFGRFFNTGPIKGSGDPLFYFHTLLWAFLPWPLLLYMGIAVKCRNIIRKDLAFEYVTLGASLTSLVIFSLSRFQLPHYLNQLFPFFAIIVAEYLYNLKSSIVKRVFVIIQNSIAGILLMLVVFLVFFIRFKSWLFLVAIFLILAIFIFLLRSKEGRLVNAITRSLLAAMVAYSFINMVLYPWLMNFQAGSRAAFYINKMSWNSTVYMPEQGAQSWSLEFYSKQPVVRINLDCLKSGGDSKALLFVQPGIYDTLLKRGYKGKILEEFPYYHISQLAGDFLYYKTRPQLLEQYKLVVLGDTK